MLAPLILIYINKKVKNYKIKKKILYTHTNLYTYLFIHKNYAKGKHKRLRRSNNNNNQTTFNKKKT